MRPTPTPRRGDEERGAALVMVLLVVSSLFVLAAGLLFQTRVERMVAASEQDQMKALEFAEAGFAWCQQRILRGAPAGTFTALLLGPDDEDDADDYLLGLRDLSLTNSGQFTFSNEGTASALVQRDFDGAGSKSYEVVRLEDGDGKRALIYARVDDNFDDDPTDPDNNDPLTDTDARIQLTVVAEYPVFIGASGSEVANVKRARARRTVTGDFAGGASMPAVLVGGDLKIEGNLSLCGPCASLHANGYVELKNEPQFCRDVTASGAWLDDGDPIYGGASGGGYPEESIPVINPYDTAYVPSIDVFDTTALSLPSELQCSAPSASDPGNAKYFAFVADDDKGLIFKAYWDFTDARWEWKLIDDLSDETDVQLDECGRAPGDPSYGTGVLDEKDDEFYGWKLEKKDDNWESCTACGGSGEDASLCQLANNDYGVNGYYDAGTGSLVTSVSGSSVPALPGSFAPDGQLDLQPGTWLKDSLWQTKNDKVYSPLYNAVVFFYGRIKIDHELAKPGKDYCSSSGCDDAPFSRWMASLIAYGDMLLNKPSYHGPANPDAGYHVQFISGRDIKIGNKLNELANTCTSGCSTTAPSNIESLAGIIAAHEQMENTNASRLFGTLVVEDAIACSNDVSNDDGHLSKFKDFHLFYDCQNPPNPWATQPVLLDWQEKD